MRLSVCITTRNRAASLGATLENILAQCPADVEVVVVDGASTDDTVRVVEELATRHPRLRLILSPDNVGLDADYDTCIQAANGEYCWLFADDDLLAPGAIERVLQACQARPLVIITDAAVYNSDFSQLELERRLPRLGQLTYRGDETATFFQDCAWHLTFIGVVIVQREFWLVRERRRYYRCEFIHCGVLFQAPIPGPIEVIREPLVQIRNGVGNWVSRWFEVWMYKWPRLLWSFSWIDPAITKKILEAEPWRSAERLLSARASGYYGWHQFRQLVVPRAQRRSHLWAPLLVAALPASAATPLGGYLRTTRLLVNRSKRRLARLSRVLRSS